MRTLVLTSFLSALTLACGGGAKKETAPPAPVAEPAPATTPVAAGPGGDASCEQVADHIVEAALASDEYKSAKPEEQKQVQEMMPQLHGQVVQECTAKPFSAETKGCLMKAATIQDISQCD